MIPLGYMAKRIASVRPEWMHAPNVIDVYSVSDCVNDSLLESNYIPDWPHNGYGMFDSPTAIEAVAKSKNIDIQGAKLFFYEAHDSELDGDDWQPILPSNSSQTDLLIPSTKQLEGFDVVTCCDGPHSHSPLSCNSVAADVKTNEHCLFQTLDEGLAALASGAFEQAEPGPYRVYAVYSVPWS
jgi:hypothetical protein